MKKALLLLLLFAPPRSHWVKQKDSYRIHWLYVNGYGNVLGEYYQPYPNSGLPVPVQPKYTASCYEGHPVEFTTEQEARDYVLRCPVW
jgi:hypothetical protein